jgi:hypothetical protein
VPGGRFSLRIASIWRGAKDLEAMQLKLAILLDRTGLVELRKLLDQVLESSAGR